MKVWVKYLLGVLLGVAAVFLLPTDNVACVNFLSFLSELFIRVGRYLVIPLVFSTAIVSINKLRSSKLLWKTIRWTFSIIVISSLILTIVGLFSILIVKLPRIPITVDVVTETYKLDIKNLILSIFPYSGFEALREGSFILVSFVFAFIIGWESSSEEITFKPVFALADACSSASPCRGAFSRCVFGRQWDTLSSTKSDRSALNASSRSSPARTCPFRRFPTSAALAPATRYANSSTPAWGCPCASSARKHD